MQLTPEQVNDFLAKSILDSKIGEAVKESVDRVLHDLKKSYQNPFDDVIRSHVNLAIEQLILTKYNDELKARVEAAMSTAITSEIIEKIVQSATEKLRSRY